MAEDVKINFPKIEQKWQKKWDEEKIFEVKENSKKPKYYILEMFPYPSGDGLHIGHALCYTIGDIYARFKRMSGFNVMHPMGYDALGLPAENAAIKDKTHPEDYTNKSTLYFQKQQKLIGLSYDWSRMINTSKSEFYKWDQWIFLKMLEKGLAYQKEAAVNWCPSCKTVLANEQAQGGICDRCKSKLEIKYLKQWFFKITNYADELLDKIDDLDWPARTKAMQKNWIGKSYGTEIDFEIEMPSEKDKIGNVVVVHGSPKEDRTKEKDYVPDSKKSWIAWIKKELDKKGINCVCPQMPTPWKPRYIEWKKELEKIKINKDSVLIGTSAGGGFLVRWLGETKTKIKKLILVSPGKVGNSDRLKEFYGEIFYNNVKDLVNEKIVIYTSEDDYDYHTVGSEEYAKSFDGKFVKFGKGYGHFTSKTLVGKDFPELLEEILSKPKWPIFTTRPDTIYGVTFMVVSAQHPNLFDLVTNSEKKNVEKFLKELKSVSEKELAEMDKQGVFTGSYAINPLTKEKIPVYAGNFVVADYASGMVMAVPAHDQRDFEFAKKYEIPIKVVIDPIGIEIESPEKMTHAYTEKGNLINSGEFNGIDNESAKSKITEFLEKKKLGRKVVQFKLRDWLISRQRYWGTPIPVTYCDKCGVVAVNEKDLPVKLPKDVKFGEGNPLKTNEKWIKTKCPKCGNANARRETDTMDTFVNSSWYFLRYCDPENNKEIFDKKKIKYWMPIDQYIGGAEHACMHLIYFRFYTKFLRDLGLLEFDEPAKKLFHQGMLHGSDREKMSKSRGNTVDPIDTIKKYSADSLRLALMSFASPDSDTNWDEKVLEGSYKFLTRIYAYYKNVKISKKSNPKADSKLNKIIKEVTNQIENFKYNLAIIKVRELFSVLFSENEVSKEVLENSLKLLHPFCPHITEELYEKIGNKNFISLSSWPIVEEKKIDETFDKQEEAVEKLVSDVVNIIKIVEQREGAGKKNKVYVYVVPNEKSLYTSEEISKRVGKGVLIYAVNDSKKYDPNNISKKTKPNRPAIYLE